MAARLGRQGEEDLETVHEINVTPFIDVILVLLIIFMIAAPLATVDVPVDLPGSTAQRQPRPEKPLFVTLTRERTLAVGEQTVSRDALGSEIDRATNSDKGQRVFLRADKSVPYGEVIEVMNALRAAGYLRLALVGLEQTSVP